MGGAGGAGGGASGHPWALSGEHTPGVANLEGRRPGRHLNEGSLGMD